MKQTIKSLWKKNKTSYLLLMGLLGGLFITNWYKNGLATTFSGLSENLLSESIGIIIVVFFIDFFRQYSEEKRSVAIEKTGLEQLKVQYNRLIQLIKSQYQETSGEKAVTTDFIFENKESVAQSICTLNLQSPCPANYGTSTPMTWEFHLKETTERLKERLDMVIAQYIYFLPDGIIEVSERIKNDALFEFFRVMSSVRTIRAQMGVPHGDLVGFEVFHIELLDKCQRLKALLLNASLTNVE